MDSVPLLKTLSPRHLDIIRRLIVGQMPQEIAIDLGMSPYRISALRGDPLFDAVYREMQDRIMAGFVETRMNAMQILEDTAPQAAQMARDAVIDGKIGEEVVPVPLRLKSAWDVLDRTGNTGVEKTLVGHVDLGQLISDAYQEKHYGKDKDEDESEDEPKNVTKLEDCTDVVVT